MTVRPPPPSPPPRLPARASLIHHSLFSAHPVSRPCRTAAGRCGVTGRATEGTARAAGCGWPRGLFLRVWTGGWTRRSCWARDGLLASASASAGLLGLRWPGWFHSEGDKPDTGASGSRNRLYTLAAAATGWLPTGRHNRFVSLLAGSYLPTESLWA